MQRIDEAFQRNISENIEVKNDKLFFFHYLGFNNKFQNLDFYYIAKRIHSLFLAVISYYFFLFDMAYFTSLELKKSCKN